MPGIHKYTSVYTDRHRQAYTSSYTQMNTGIHSIHEYIHRYTPVATYTHMHAGICITYMYTPL